MEKHTHAHTHSTSLPVIKDKAMNECRWICYCGNSNPTFCFNATNNRKSLKFLPHHLHWKHFLGSDESWIALVDCYRVTEYGESNLFLSFQGYELNRNVKTSWGIMTGLIDASRSVKWTNAREGNEGIYTKTLQTQIERDS